MWNLFSLTIKSGNKTDKFSLRGPSSPTQYALGLKPSSLMGTQKDCVSVLSGIATSFPLHFFSFCFLFFHFPTNQAGDLPHIHVISWAEDNDGARFLRELQLALWLWLDGRYHRSRRRISGTDARNRILLALSSSQKFL